MSYTLEQKREALARYELWWRLPDGISAGDRAWSLCGICISSSDAEYHIGPTPPRVLSELEGELLEALRGRAKDAEQSAFENWLARVCPSGDVEDVHRQWEASSDFDEFNRWWADAHAAIQKAESTQ